MGLMTTNLTPVEKRILEDHLQHLRNSYSYMNHASLDVEALQAAVERTNSALVDVLRILLGRER